jgi:hypothetical protein
VGLLIFDTCNQSAKIFSMRIDKTYTTLERYIVDVHLVGYQKCIVLSARRMRKSPLTSVFDFGIFAHLEGFDDRRVSIRSWIEQSENLQM